MSSITWALGIPGIARERKATTVVLDWATRLVTEYPLLQPVLHGILAKVTGRLMSRGYVTNGTPETPDLNTLLPYVMGVYNQKEK